MVVSCRGTSRDLPNLLPRMTRSRCPVHVLPVEADGLPDSQAGDRQQPEEGLVGRGSEWGTQPLGCAHEPRNILLRVQVGCDAPNLAWQEIGRRDFCTRVDRPEILGEATDEAELLGPPSGMAVGWLPGPAEGELGGDGLRAVAVEKADEIWQQTPGPARACSRGCDAGRDTGQGSCEGRSSAFSRPGLREQTEGRAIDLGVDGGGEQAAMTEDLRDL